MKSDEQLINNIIGQLEGIKKMIHSNQDCFNIINQLKAVRSAVDSLCAKIAERRIIDCLKIKKTDQNLKKIIEQIIKK